jgi:hypothetical protein
MSDVKYTNASPKMATPPVETEVRATESTEASHTGALIQHVKLDTGDGTNQQPAGVKIFDTLTSTYKGLQFNAEAPQVCAQDYLQALAEGDIAGHSMFDKYGRVTGIQTTLTDVWDYGATTALYVFPAAAAKMRVVSDNIADDVGQAGATKIKINGLIAGYVDTTEEVTMDGTTPVQTAQSWLRINKVWVSAGANAVGNIKVYHLTNATPIYAYISATYTQSRQLIYTVPTGQTLYITSVTVSSGVGNTTSSGKYNYVSFTLRATVDPGSRAVSTLFYPEAETGIINAAFYRPFLVPLKIPATADLKMQVQGDTAQAVICTAAMRGWIE